MAYELLDRPLLWIPVAWAGLVAGENDGIAQPVEHEIEVLVELVDKEQVRSVFGLAEDGRTVAEERDEFVVVKTLCSGWRRITYRGSTLPFTDDNLRRVVYLPNFMGAFTLAYMSAVGGRVATRLGNSEGSQSGGRADEATAGTEKAATKP
jgi:hypothetical protein